MFVRRGVLTTILALAILAPSLALAAKPVVQINKARNGAAVISVKNAYRSSTWPSNKLRPRTLKMTVPMAIARRLITAAGKGGIQVSTQRDVRGPMLRVIAGQGKDAVVVSRYRRAGPNGQTSADGVRTVQFGIGKNAAAYYVGATRGATEVRGTKFRGGSTVTRSGWSTFINPTTLKPTKGKADGKLRWYWKSVPKRLGRTTSPSKALDGFHPSDFYVRHDELQKRRAAPRRTVTAARATLVQDLAQGL